MSRRRSRSNQWRVPDWVWGAGFGVIILIFVGGYFAIDRATGGGGDGPACDEPLVPLGSSQIDEETFQQVDEGLGRVIESLQRGDRAGAEASFYGPVHNFTHNVDPALRAEDEDAAKVLCEEVLEIEDELFTGANEDVLESVQVIRQVLREAAVTLGYQAPG